MYVFGIDTLIVCNCMYRVIQKSPNLNFSSKILIHTTVIMSPGGPTTYAPWCMIGECVIQISHPKLSHSYEPSSFFFSFFFHIKFLANFKEKKKRKANWICTRKKQNSKIFPIYLSKNSKNFLEKKHSCIPSIFIV
jgi:hypothetical protein